MATGGFKSNSATDFLEEWKAKREKMRAKMLGDIAAATGRATELNNNGSSVNCVSSSSSYPVTRSSSSTALKDEPKKPEPPGENLKKTPEKVSGVPQAECSSPAGVDDSDKESPSHSKSKEKKSSGPSARKGKGQIEKRKLREKRRSTGVVSIPSNESLDELDDDDGEEKERKVEESLTQHNTVQNEAMTPDPEAAYSIQRRRRKQTSPSTRKGRQRRSAHSPGEKDRGARKGAGRGEAGEQSPVESPRGQGRADR
ncbi:PRKC apoptosis WT1 regulator protein isoform X2 [Onychostoma macrolepis]|uniref:PRKC apoptosis WT1 regulator protein isoform X2 n=1 Tax=Onychostoma macrolepis TaxID=369639 RepID=UPI00272A9A9A|nr:PRKC apoptosis WT1 regulator protein isoform X2 [Onychostoma macrolepis]